MKLLAAGDSFTYGQELSDIKLSWPYLLGNKLDYRVENLGTPSASNTKIIRNILTSQPADIIIIAWSHFARTELADENGVYDVWPGCRSFFGHTNLAYRTNILEYNSKHFNDEYLYRQYLINIVLIQSYLKGQKYLMLDAFGNHQTDYRRNAEQNKDLVDQIDTAYYMGWPDESMMEWAYNAPIGPNGHFLEQGHEQVANKIYEHIRHLGWIS
jgi:hypothetical protein